jgi:hypothetical protein
MYVCKYILIFSWKITAKCINKLNLNLTSIASWRIYLHLCIIKGNECFQLKITLLEYKIHKTYTMEGNASSLWKRVYGDVLATGRLTLQNQNRASLKITSLYVCMSGLILWPWSWGLVFKSPDWCNFTPAYLCQGL